MIVSFQKKGGGQRLVLDLSTINQFIEIEHFKMENLATLKSLLNMRDYMINLDLTDTYLTVPMHPDFQKYISLFSVRGQIHRNVIQPECSPQAPHKNHEAGCCVTKESGCPFNNISGQHFDHSVNRNIKSPQKAAVDLLESLGFLIN